MTDSEVGVLAVRKRAGGDPIAVVLVYGMHPTVLQEDSTLVSADLPHYARMQLKEALGEALTVVYQTAPCGNQSPRRFVTGQTFEEAQRSANNVVGSNQTPTGTCSKPTGCDRWDPRIAVHTVPPVAAGGLGVRGKSGW